MTPQQFDLIIKWRFSRLSKATVNACKLVIINGVSAYAAENYYSCNRGTVSRYVNKIYAELELCEMIASHL